MFNSVGSGRTSVDAIRLQCLNKNWSLKSKTKIRKKSIEYLAVSQIDKKPNI